MSIGGNPAVAGSVPLGDTVDQVLYDGNECDKVILDGVVVWERNYTLSGTATYSPITRRVNYEVTLGDLTSWSYRAVKNDGGVDTGEVAISSGTTAESAVLGVSEDGTWTVTFKGFKNGVEKATVTTAVTVATPYVEITSVEELTEEETPASNPFDPRGTMWSITKAGSSWQSPGLQLYNASEAVAQFGTTHLGNNVAAGTQITGGYGKLGTYDPSSYHVRYFNQNGYFSFSLTVGTTKSVYGEVAVSQEVPIGGTLTWTAQAGPYQSTPTGTTPSGVIGQQFVLTRTA